MTHGIDGLELEEFKDHYTYRFSKDNIIIKNYISSICSRNNYIYTYEHTSEGLTLNKYPIQVYMIHIPMFKMSLETFKSKEGFDTLIDYILETKGIYLHSLTYDMNNRILLNYYNCRDEVTYSKIKHIYEYNVLRIKENLEEILE
jgi:hypothetical protein